MDLVVVSSLKQTLDASRCRPRVERIGDLIGGQEWANDAEEEQQRPVCTPLCPSYAPRKPMDASQSKRIKRQTAADLIEQVQASTQEIEDAFKHQRILEIDGFSRPVATSYLPQLLQALIRAVDSDATTPLVARLAEEAEIDAHSAEQIVGWFSSSPDSTSIDDLPVLAELGKAVLRSWKAIKKDENGAFPLSEFMTEWAALAGDRLETSCSLALLEVCSLLVLTCVVWLISSCRAIIYWQRTRRKSSPYLFLHYPLSLKLASTSSSPCNPNGKLKRCCLS